MIMNTFDDLFQKLGGPAQVGRVIGVTTEHTTSMKRRGSIPARYWPALISRCAANRVSGVTYKVLARLAAGRRSANAAESEAA
jgi:hypothetical protein